MGVTDGEDCDKFTESQCKILDENLLGVQYGVQTKQECQVINMPDFWGRSPGFESGISHNDPGALQDYYEILQNLRRGGNLHLRQNNNNNNNNNMPNRDPGGFG